MAHFAEIDENNIVTRVIVAEQDFIDSGALGDPARWIQTSYNTYGGIHLLGGSPMRKNFAGVGYKYDQGVDGFIPPKPYLSWSLDKDSCLWQPPTPRPSDRANYYWNEDTLSWEVANA